MVEYCLTCGVNYGKAIRIGVEVQPVAGDLRPGIGSNVRIVNRNRASEEVHNIRIGEQFREVARMHLGGWHRQQDVLALREAISLKIEKEKRPIYSLVHLGNPNRSADVETEVVFAIHVAGKI